MITVEITRRYRRAPVDSVALRKLVRAVCRRSGVSRATVSVAIVDDAEMSELNEEFRGRQRPTDCLSFDLSDEGVGNEARLFDLVVNGELAVREADRRGHTAQAEVALYVVHALLHQLGFDDATAHGAREMHRTEDEILQQFGYGLVYNADVRAR